VRLGYSAGRIDVKQCGLIVRPGSSLSTRVCRRIHQPPEKRRSRQCPSAPVRAPIARRSGLQRHRDKSPVIGPILRCRPHVPRYRVVTYQRHVYGFFLSVDVNRGGRLASVRSSRAVVLFVPSTPDLSDHRTVPFLFIV